MATQGIDFTNLTLMDALDLAVLVEDEARERYEDFVFQMEQHRTPEAAKFFRYMVENETKHGQQLAERRKELFGATPAVVTEAMLFDVEAPDYDATRAFMTPRAAMLAALSSEKKAYTFFSSAIPAIRDPQVRALFAELRDEELEHPDLVLAEIEKLPEDALVSDEDFVDPPNSPD